MLPFTFRLTRLLSVLACASGVAALSAQTLPAASPFLPPKAGTTAAGDGAKYQLGGMITKGKDVLISITRVSNKQSFWVPVGGTVDEVTAVSYQPDIDQAVISAHGERFTLRLRQSAVQVGASAAAVAAATAAMTPPLPPPVGPPEVQEREARMLVTDLLEIGQEHRRAYEAAQKKAAAAAAKK